MTDLYFRPGSPPASLLFEAYDPSGRLWTDLANNAEGREATGFRPAPPRPADTDAQTAEWDADAEAWVMVDRPPPPPAPEPDPTANYIPIPLLRQRIERLGMWDDFAGYLAQRPALFLKVLSLEAGVDPAYPALTDAFTEMQIPAAIQSYILARPSEGAGDPPSMG